MRCSSLYRGPREGTRRCEWKCGSEMLKVEAEVEVKVETPLPSPLCPSLLFLLCFSAPASISISRSSAFLSLYAWRHQVFHNERGNANCRDLVG